MKKILFLFLSITISSFAQIKDAYYYNNAVYDSIWEKDPRLSIEYLTKAIELDSNDAVFYYNRSKAWNKLGYRINSLNDINKAISINPDDGLYYYWKARYLYSV